MPATGSLDYVYIVLPTGFTKDTWVAAAEARPSARSAVHHILAVVRPPGSQWMKGGETVSPVRAAAALGGRQRSTGETRGHELRIARRILPRNAATAV